MSMVLFCLLAISPIQDAFAQYVCQINGAPELRNGSIAAGDATQNARINRDGTPSSCVGGAPTAAPVAGTFRFDSYNFTNPHPTEACVVVEYDMTACGGTANNSTQVNAYSSFNPASPNTNVIGEPGFSTIGTGTLTFRVTAGQAFTIVVHEVVANGGCAAYNFRLTYRTGCRQPGFDATNDGKADLAFFRPSNGFWHVLNSAGGATALPFGASADIITPGDYTGDGATDLSTYRHSANTWFFSRSQSDPANNVTYVPWGIAGDVPVPNDYDRDGKTDVALWRPSNGGWYILRSSDGTFSFRLWGLGSAGDIPITGDYDGDLMADIGVVRPIAGEHQWLLQNSNFGNGFWYGCGTVIPTCLAGVKWGATTDRPVVGDFDGDARTDIAVFRPSNGTWYYLRSSAGVGNAPGTPATAHAGFTWGVTGDIPQAADYDGDKKSDFAVFRPSSGTWWVNNSNNGSFSATPWGTSTDQPAASPYLITNP